MATEQNNLHQVELVWWGAKEQLRNVVTELYQKAGSYELPFPIYDLGHPSRPFINFPTVLTLRNLEDSVLDDTRVKEDSQHGSYRLTANIGASTLLEQLHDAIEAYLNTDPEKQEEFRAERGKNEAYARKLKTLKAIATAVTNTKVKLEMFARASKNPQYEIESYSLV